jgi:Flp pilus assembly pilin Flp
MRRPFAADERGAAAVEMAFALPVLIVMLWAFVQLAQVYRAVAGIQMALGEGARYATLCLTQSATGCTAPSAPQVKAKINSTIYGLGPGTFTVNDPVGGISGTARYYDLTVSYSQPTDLLMFPGPTMSVSRSKRVWISTSA